MVGLVMTNSAQQVFEQLSNQQAKIADQASWQQAIATGFAKPTDEDWRYTKLDDFFQLDFKLSIPSVVSAQQVQALALPLDSYLLVFVNGEYQSHLSSDDWLIGGSHGKLTSYQRTFDQFSFKVLWSMFDNQELSIKGQWYSLEVENAKGVMLPNNVIQKSSSATQ